MDEIAPPLIRDFGFKTYEWKNPYFPPDRILCDTNSDIINSNMNIRHQIKKYKIFVLVYFLF